MRDKVYRLIYVGQSSEHIAKCYLRRLARLHQEGFEVHVLAADDGGFPQLIEHGILACPLPLQHSMNIAGWAGAYFIMQAYLLENPPTLVHVFDTPLAWIGAFAARRAGGEVVVASHTSSSGLAGLERWNGSGIRTFLSNTVADVRDILGSQQVGQISDWWYGLLANQLDCYIVSQLTDYERLVSKNSIDPDKLEVIDGGWGVDLNVFDASSEDVLPLHEAREALNIPQHWRQVIGCAATNVSPRELDDLLECIRQVHSSHPSVGWILNIEGELSRRERTHLLELVEADRVRFYRTGDDAPTFFRLLDVFLSLQSNTPQAYTHLIESSAMSVCSVAYESPWSRLVIVDGQTGMLVVRNDSAAIAQSLRVLLNDPKRLYTYGSNARNRVIECFDQDEIDTQILTLYDRLLALRIA